MEAGRKLYGHGIEFALIWLLVIAALPAHAQTASAQLSISLSVQSSISLVFNDNPSVGTQGFCPLSNAGTNNVGLDFGSASFPGNAHSSTCVNYRHIPPSYEVSSAFDVLVTKSNSSSPSYRLAARISTAPPANVVWLVNNIPLNNLIFVPLDLADDYGRAVTKTLQVQVRNTVPAQALQETITFLATAN
ncbi:MAG: hypothetical protein ACRD4F_15790 [Candidatus Angelobacter sp.]